MKLCTKRNTPRRNSGGEKKEGEKKDEAEIIEASGEQSKCDEEESSEILENASVTRWDLLVGNTYRVNPTSLKNYAQAASDQGFTVLPLIQQLLQISR